MARGKLVRKNVNRNLVRARCKIVRQNLLYMTSAELAKALGYSTQSEVAKMESGQAFNTDYIYRLADYAGVSLDYLYGRTEFAECTSSTAEQIAVLEAARSFSNVYFQQISNALLSVVKYNSCAVEIGNALDAFSELSRSWARFLQLNPTKYQNMRGGTNVENAIAKLSSVTERLKKIDDKAKKNIQTFRDMEKTLMKKMDGMQLEFKEMQ